MRNYVQSGNILTLTAPYALSSGDGLLVGSVFAIAGGDAAQGDDVEGALTGVFTLPKVAADVFAQGADVYWDNTAKTVTATTTDNTKIGVATVAAGASDSTATVRLNGAF